VIVVSDTGPLNYLTLIRQADKLPRLYGQVIVPTAVAEELSQKEAPEAVRRFIEHPPAWLQIRPARFLDPQLSQLEPGEQQAISLAQELKADLLLCDDQEARGAAASRNIRVIGTLGVLRDAALQGLLDIRSVVHQLQATTSIYLASELADRVIAEVERTLQQDRPTTTDSAQGP
jgi:predicted nucleic acid-binding protein